MGTEVLRPQDCLIERIRVAPAVFNRRKNSYVNGNPRYRKPAVRPDFARPDQKKRFSNPSEPSISRRSSSPDDFGKSNNLLMEHVTILRRGEALDSKAKADHQASKKNGDDFIMLGTERLGPNPNMVQKQIRIGDMKAVAKGFRPDVYAGSAFSLSPSPSALPLPSFFSKKQVSEIVVVDDSATRDLRRLLRLE